MKKILAVAALAAFASCALFAQAPDKVKENFRKENPNAMNVVWKSDGDQGYRVTYSENKTEHALVYDKSGNITGRQTTVSGTSVPTTITEYYTKRASGNEYAPSYTVWKSTDNAGNVTYYSEYNGKQTYFDKDGKVMTRQGMAEGENDKKDEKVPLDK